MHADDRDPSSSDERPLAGDRASENGGIFGVSAGREDDAERPVLSLAEARLFARAAEGDREAIGEVWRANRRWIAAVLAAHAPRGADIDDLLQEVASTLITKCHHLRDAASLRGWLRVVAVNTARMAARSLSSEIRTQRGFADLRRGLERGIQGAARAATDAREMLALLSRLPQQYAEPLLLQATQGLSQRQIAELLDVPETTVETRLARARRMLREMQTELESGGAPTDAGSAPRRLASAARVDGPREGTRTEQGRRTEQ
ncbi:MAG: sigma-70 family RNA polymerase sigma factor [Phycisphaera sp.]|nr:sigma-70 family RNA polymerase sigma factor [Phycisphaera sp.]